MQSLEHELKSLIVAVVGLDSVTASSLDATTKLFDEGLGLDSIDALQLATAIQERFGVQLPGEDGAVRAVLASVRSLTEYLAGQAAAGPGRP